MQERLVDAAEPLPDGWFDSPVAAACDAVTLPPERTEPEPKAEETKAEAELDAVTAEIERLDLVERFLVQGEALPLDDLRQLATRLGVRFTRRNKAPSLARAIEAELTQESDLEGNEDGAHG